MPPNPIILWGAAGHARVLRDILGAGRIVAVFDRQRVTPPWDVPLHVGIEGFEAWRRDNPGQHSFAVAIGGARGADRLEIAERLSAQGFEALTVVHGSAVVEPSAVIEPGAQVLAQAFVGAEARIGSQSILNSGASVDHDSAVGPGCHLAPGVTVCGEVSIGARVFIGAGATIGPRVRIGEGAVIGAGSVVLQDIAPGARMAGVPARPLSPARSGA
ncbi:MAG: acetyltransferase [Pseudomonadota bacterium]